MRIEIDIPEKCQKCDFENFNIWGTKNGNTRIQVKCMRCGNENFRVDIARGETIARVRQTIPTARAQ